MFHQTLILFIIPLGRCLSMLPSPPSNSPTNSAMEAGFWYADFDTPFSKAGCLNKLPLPFNHPQDRANYPTQLECCKAAYGGQMSGMCLRQLSSPPTASPKGSGGATFWYPDYNTPWAEATCINSLPFAGGRITYSTKEACCSGAYGGQYSLACICSLTDAPIVCFTIESKFERV